MMISRWVFSWCHNDSNIMAGIYADRAETCGLSLLASRCLQLYPFVIRLLNVIMFHTFGECESQALELMSGPILHLECPVMKRSLAITTERLLFHMTDFHNCSKINLWNQRKSSSSCSRRGLWLSQRKCVCQGFPSCLMLSLRMGGDLESLQISPSCVHVNIKPLKKAICIRWYLFVSVSLWIKMI